MLMLRHEGISKTENVSLTRKDDHPDDEVWHGIEDKDSKV